MGQKKKKMEGEMGGQSEREEAHKGRGQNTSKSDSVALPCAQLQVSK